MNKLRISLLLLCTATLALAADTKLTGEWQVQRNAAGRESTGACTFTQQDNDLGGTCTTPGGPVKLTGKVDGKKITWTIKAESEAGPVTVVYAGTLESDDAMSGSVTAVEFSVEGEFKATRSK
ncbi:MAG: hypothetical protein IPP47_19080 [Bryobacterales bacterium]|nr:hypothetical protein [Bryobacterales bacterium]